MQADLDALLLAYKADSTQLDPLLQAVIDKAEHVASTTDARIDAESIGTLVALDVHKRLPSIADKLTGLVVVMAKRRTVEALRKLKKDHRAIEEYEDIRQLPAALLSDEDQRKLAIAEEVMGPDVAFLLSEGCSYREVSAELGISASTLRAKARKIRKMTTKRPTRLDYISSGVKRRPPGRRVEVKAS